MIDDKRLYVPQYAKDAASRGLEKRMEYSPSRKPGLTKTEASKLGIASGVERAKQLINNESISMKDAKRVAAFNRFKNCSTPRCQVAKDLWGGQQFINKAVKHVKENK